MMLGFKRRFKPMVLDHSKFHTIRAKGARRWRVGVICDCYCDARQKTMHLLGRFPCVKVEEITITLREDRWIEIRIAGVMLTPDEASAFAWRDGFRPRGSSERNPKDSLGLMMEFWIYEHRVDEKPFVGDLIFWDPEAEVSEADRWRKVARAA